MLINKTTIVVYEYSGSTSELTIPFDYLKRDFVVVALGGDGKPQKALKLGIDYRFATKTTIVITRQYQPDEGYNKVIIRRVTDASKRIINYQDGSILNASELNTSQLQALHVAEEARDLANYTLFVDDNNNLDARGRKIINLGDPTNPQDAVTKKYVDTASESVIDSRNKALQYRDEAEEFKNKTQSLRDESESFKDEAKRYASDVSSKIEQANKLNVEANKNSTKALEAVSNAQRSAQEAEASAIKAKASEKNAKVSEEKARDYANTIDPDTLVRKSMIAQELGDDVSRVVSQALLSREVSKIKEIKTYNSEFIDGVSLVNIEGVYVNGSLYILTPKDGSSSKANGLVNSLNVSEYPYTVSVGGVSFYLLENKYINNVFIDIRAFGAKGDSVTDDTKAIQEALNYSVLRYKKPIVVVPPSRGEYVITTVKVGNNTIFKGLGGVLRIKDNFITEEKAYYPIHNLGCSNTIFESLTINGNYTNNNKVTPTVCDSITCVGENSSVIDCVIRDSIDSGIMFSGSNNGFCSGNIVEGATDLCIYVNSGDANATLMSIVNNTCINAPYGGIGIKRKSSGMIISSNKIKNCGNGITVETFRATRETPKDLLITSNILENIGYTKRGDRVAEAGIIITDGSEISITNNVINNCSGNCIEIAEGSNITVNDNSIVGYKESPASSNTGIKIGTLVSNTTVVDNKIVKVASHGIHVNGANNIIISNNTVEAIEAGIRADSTTRSTIISDNICKSSIPSIDLEIYSSTDVILKGNIQASSSNEFNKHGIQTFSSGTSIPPNAVTPTYIGEIRVHLSNNSVWLGVSKSPIKWVRLDNTESVPVKLYKRTVKRGY